MHMSWPPAHKYFSIYLLRIGMFSCLSTVQLSPSVHSKLILCDLYSSFVNWHNYSFYNFPSSTDPLRSGIKYSGQVSLAVFNLEHFCSLSCLLWKWYFWRIQILLWVEQSTCWIYPMSACDFEAQVMHSHRRCVLRMSLLERMVSLCHHWWS